MSFWESVFSLYFIETVLYKMSTIKDHLKNLNIKHLIHHSIKIWIRNDYKYEEKIEIRKYQHSVYFADNAFQFLHQYNTWG